MNDETYLEMLNDMISSKDETFIVPAHMKEGIRQGEEDIRNGRVHSREEFEEKYKEYL